MAQRKCQSVYRKCNLSFQATGNRVTGSVGRVGSAGQNFWPSSNTFTWQQPKSPSLQTSLRVTMTLAGLRSRCTMRASWR